MRVDSHQHFWYYDPVREGWIPENMKKIRRDYLPEDLEPVLKRNKMDACVLVQANDSEAETELLLQWAQEHSFVQGVVGWTDLRSETCSERLKHYSRNPYFKGIRHTLQSEAPEFMLQEEFQEGISALARFGLTYDLLILEKHLSAAKELVSRFPQQLFVLDHMAKPQITRGISTGWEAGIKELAKADNVYCKLSGFLVETENLQWQEKEFHPFFEHVYQNFGEDRIMFGSDWPVCLGGGTYEDTQRILAGFFKGKSENVIDKLMGENAAAFYKLVKE